MRVLLLGEFSGVHTDLANALKKNDIAVLTAHHGDAFKNYPRDIDLTSSHPLRLVRYFKILKNYIRLIALIKREQFEIIQIINPGIFPDSIAGFMIRLLIKVKAKTFLLACGDDDLIWEAYRSKTYRYYAFDGMLQHDPEAKQIIWDDESFKKLSVKLRNHVNAIIPSCVEYQLAYARKFKGLPFVPLSIDTAKIGFDIQTKNYSKIKILHGVNKGREGVKGTYFIKPALERIKEKYGYQVEVIYTESLPFEEYKRVLADVTIVIDQPYGYSPSMNALYAMYFGCITFSGAEPEYLASLQLQTAPVINILPDVNDIYIKINELLESGNIEQISKESHAFVKAHHAIDKNVHQYLKIWATY